MTPVVHPDLFLETFDEEMQLYFIIKSRATCEAPITNIFDMNGMYALILCFTNPLGWQGAGRALPNLLAEVTICAAQGRHFLALSEPGNSWIAWLGCTPGEDRYMGGT